MDLKTSYWQINVDERHREKTVFIALDVLFKFMTMPFGLCAAPVAFQHVVDKVLAGSK